MRRSTAAVCWIVCIIITLCSGHPSAAGLSFDQRVDLQGQIEGVYYSHQISSTRPFEEAVPRDVLEQKVRRYLKQTVILDMLWNTPVTADDLLKEASRMRVHSKMPERLQELYAAVGNDSFLFEETVARAALVDRLTRNFFAFDRLIHVNERSEAERLRGRLRVGDSGALSDLPAHIVMKWVEDNSGSIQDSPVKHRQRSGFKKNRANGSGELLSASQVLPRTVSGIVETRNSFAVEVEVFDPVILLPRRARFVVPKIDWDQWWSGIETNGAEEAVPPVAYMNQEGEVSQEASTGIAAQSVSGASLASGCRTDDIWMNGTLDDPPDPRNYHSAVWTGTHMLIWGGIDHDPLDTGNRYDPATDTWEAISRMDAPARRFEHTAVWTGELMLVWGGRDEQGRTLVSAVGGGRYNPLTDTWEPIADQGEPAGRHRHSTVWTGSEMVVWGGITAWSEGSNVLGNGGRYNPATDTWQDLPLSGVVESRQLHTAVWTGQEMIVWGGAGGLWNHLNTGGKYDPITDSWTAVSTIDAPDPRRRHSAVWDGARMIVWGGGNYTTGYQTTGALYDPENDNWEAMTSVGAPSERLVQSAVWTGTEMIIWGGNGDAELGTGARYDPNADSWSPTSMINAPLARAIHTAVWTGDEMIVWGGRADTGNGETNSGGRYDPNSDSWMPTSVTLAPQGRTDTASVWTGSLMIIWGGDGGYIDRHLRSGSRYDPATDTWMPTSMTDAPEARYGHSAVWTGSEMIIWGGYGTNRYRRELISGGRYEPISDTWFATNQNGAPQGRRRHSAIWTGSEMIVWGGRYFNRDLDTGGRYDPGTDTWEALPSLNAPLARSYHAAVWTDDEMLIWGGESCEAADCAVTSTGGRYSPASDTWSATSMVNAPPARAWPAGVWSGSEMIVWGGGDEVGHLASGGHYNPSIDLWIATAQIGAPSARSGHQGVWTGEEMIIWGGQDETAWFDSGGRYDPDSMSWEPTSEVGRPGPRAYHEAVWTGDEMIVWGGDSGSLVSSGGRYCACDSQPYYKDADNDGFGDPNEVLDACIKPAGFVLDATDCDDNDPATHPAAMEHCDGTDNDCDGSIDDGFGVGDSCAVPLDECNRIVGTLACLADGTGTVCVGLATPYDVTPPVITCPTMHALECPASAAGIGSAVAGDACDAMPVVTNDAPVTFPLGETTVTWFARDGDGNTSTCQQVVTVHDTSPPTIQVSANPQLLWPPNHRLVPVNVMWSVHDTCDPGPSVTLTSLSSSEPDDAEGNGDGKTTGDIEVVTDELLLLRAERSGSGEGRVYEATYRARDASSNEAVSAIFITVPHSVGGTTEPVMINAEHGIEGTLLAWSDVVGAELHSVVRGRVDNVREKLDRYDLGQLTCIAGSIPGNDMAGLADPDVPQPGEIFFYLVEYSNGVWSGLGTESAAKERSAAPGQANCR